MNINYFAFLSFIKKMSLNSGNNSSVIFCKSFSLLFIYKIHYIYQTNLIKLIYFIILNYEIHLLIHFWKYLIHQIYLLIYYICPLLH